MAWTKYSDSETQKLSVKFDIQQKSVSDILLVVEKSVDGQFKKLEFYIETDFYIKNLFNLNIETGLFQQFAQKPVLNMNKRGFLWQRHKPTPRCLCTIIY